MADTKSELFIISLDQAFLAQFRPELRKYYSLVLAADERVISNLLKSRSGVRALVDMDSYVKNCLSILQNYGKTTHVISISKSWSADLDIYALEQGSDVSIPTPIDIRQLIIRLRSPEKVSIQTRETKPLPFSRPTEPIHCKGLTVFPNEYVVRRGEEIVSITPTQFRLLVAFLTQRNQLLTRFWLRERIWNGTKISPRSIDAQISKLKKKLPELENRLINIYGEGYVFNDIGIKSA
jgi:DNA-binding response OmpR family regulator